MKYEVTWAAYCILFHPLAKFPGPFFAKFSRIPIIWTTIQGNTWQWTERLHQKYGTFVRIAPEEVTTVRPAAWRDIYVSRPYLPKDPFSQTPPMNGADSLFTAAGETHGRMRRTFGKAFYDKSVKDQSPIIEGHVDLFINRLKRETTRNPVLDIAKFYGYATLDIIADLTYGESFHGLEDENEHDWVLRFFLGAKFGSVRNSLSRIYPIDRIFGWIFLRLTAVHRSQNWHEATTRITSRIKSSNQDGRQDFLAPILEDIAHSNDLSEVQGRGVTRKEVNTHGLAVVIAGCQLTTVALATATHLMLQNPLTYRELQLEVREAFSNEDQINVASVEKLPYLSAVIDETLRFHHPTPINLPRIVGPEGLVVDGEFIPPKQVVGVNLQNIQNNPNLWTAPREFHPERFLPQSDARYDSRFDKDDKQAFKPFAIGPRNCMGGKVFLAEAKMILARMFWRFDLAECAGQEDWMNQKAYLVFEPRQLLVNMVDTKP